MKTLLSIAFGIFGLINFTNAQSIQFSEILKDDIKTMNFEILGNFGENALVYKSHDTRHRVTIYNKEMKIVDDVKLDFITSRTYNSDFIKYQNHFVIVYQYQKGSNVYCNAAKVSADGKLIDKIIPLDTTRIGVFANNKIYYLAVSENKEKILMYTMQYKNDNLYLNTFLYNQNFDLLDRTKSEFEYNSHKDSYDDIVVGNDGVFYFVKQTKGNWRNYAEQIELFYHRPDKDGLENYEVLLNDVHTKSLALKIDNKNNLLFLNGFYFNKKIDSKQGLLSIAYYKQDSLVEKRRNTVAFSEDVKSKLSHVKNGSKYAFDDFEISNVVAKTDSGLMLTLENAFTEDRGRYYNRYYGGGYNPFYSNFGYYSFQRFYYSPYYYSPYVGNYYGNNQSISYYFQDILMINLNNELQLTWENIINKKQNDLDSDNFLSFGNANINGELHYFFLQNDKNKDIISDFAILSDGTLKRYSTIKGGEKGYIFMPKFCKQITSNYVIMPALYKSRICFMSVQF